MRKGCIILLMFLASLVANAQVPGYSNGGLREELRAWWRGVRGQQATFHSQDNVSYQNAHRDEISGTTYGFASSNVGQTQRWNSAGVRTDEWGVLVSERSFAGKQATPSRAYRNAEGVVVSAEKSPLKREVWSDRKTNGGLLYVGGGGAAIYGSKASGRNSYGGAVFTGGTVGFATRNGGESSRSANDFLDSSGSSGNGSFGFGEVPHDDSSVAPPVGDGILLLTLMALAFAVVKNRYWRICYRH